MKSQGQGQRTWACCQSSVRNQVSTTQKQQGSLRNWQKGWEQVTGPDTNGNL